MSAGAGADAGSPRAAHCTTSGIIIFSPSSGERAMRCEMTISTARQQSCTTTYVTSMCCTYPISSRLYLFLRAAPRDEHSAGGRRESGGSAGERRQEAHIPIMTKSGSSFEIGGICGAAGAASPMTTVA